MVPMGFEITEDIWEGEWFKYKLDNDICRRLQNFSDGGMQRGEHDCIVQPHLVQFLSGLVECWACRKQMFQCTRSADTAWGPTISISVLAPVPSYNKEMFEFQKFLENIGPPSL